MLEKGLTLESANQIGRYVKRHGGRELIEELCIDDKLMSQPDFKTGIEDVKLLFQYSAVMGFLDKVRKTSFFKSVAILCVFFYSYRLI